ncbi:MAG: amidohydrolase, partial [Nitrospirae bacterium]|nr:amidohydrolase [Fimbriimonadaceae bacterium]
MLCVVLALAFASAPADLVVRNARIWSDGLPAFAESLAVRDGRFVHVGGERSDLVGPHTQVVDAGGR